MKHIVRYISFVALTQHSLLKRIFVLDTSVSKKSCENSYGKFRIRFPGVSFHLKLSIHRSCRGDLQHLPKNSFTYIYISIYTGVPKPMSQTSPGYSPPLIKQKGSYQHASKSEQVPGYPLTFMCGYPLRYYIKCSKCWPFAATHPFRRHIMDSLTRTNWPGRFLIAPNAAAMRSHNSSTLVTGLE